MYMCVCVCVCVCVCTQKRSVYAGVFCICICYIHTLYKEMDLEYISEYRIQGMLNRAVLLCILIELFCYAY